MDDKHLQQEGRTGAGAKSSHSGRLHITTAERSIAVTLIIAVTIVAAVLLI